jgi:hypothetical protein
MDIVKTTRRIVTGHDAAGKAVAIFDAPIMSRQRSPGGNALTMLWVTAESPADVSEGDVLIQQGTNHAWVNNGTKPCRIAFILIDAQEPRAWNQGWKK